MKYITVFVMTLTCAFSSLRGADLDMSGLDTPNDKLPAARRLLSWVKSLGYSATLSEDNEMVLIKDYRLSIYPVLNADGIDRIIVQNIYAGNPANTRDDKLAATIAIINKDFHAAQVSVMDNGSIRFTTYLTFDDMLSPRLFKLFMEHSNRIAEFYINKNKKLSDCIK